MKPSTPDQESSAAPLSAVSVSAPVVQIYDTTLRDGTQREGLSLSAVDKIRIARLVG